MSIGVPSSVVPDARLEVWSHGEEASLDVVKGSGNPTDPILRVWRDNNKVPNNLAFAVNGSGYVGIGALNPDQMLHMESPFGEVAIKLRRSSPGTSYSMGIPENSDAFAISIGGDLSRPILTASPFGNVGIGADYSPTLGKLDVRAGGDLPALSVSKGGGGPSLMVVYKNNPYVEETKVFSIDRTGEVTVGNLARADAHLRVMGEVTTRALNITGGSDLAWRFKVNEVSSSTSEATQITKPMPGMLVSIDRSVDGRLQVSRGAYDSAVAGVISGAGDIHVGMTMGQSGSMADGDTPVTSTGRVWVWADATYGAISRGDRLTSSETPGHAMKVADREKGDGTSIGKAMSELKSGKGLVLVWMSMN